MLEELIKIRAKASRTDINKRIAKRSVSRRALIALLGPAILLLGTSYAEQAVATQGWVAGALEAVKNLCYLLLFLGASYYLIAVRLANGYAWHVMRSIEFLKKSFEVLESLGLVDEDIEKAREKLLKFEKEIEMKPFRAFKAHLEVESEAFEKIIKKMAEKGLVSEELVKVARSLKTSENADEHFKAHKELEEKIIDALKVYLQKPVELGSFAGTPSD
jgi:hypothetical protein